MTLTEDHLQLADLNALGPEDLLRWAYERHGSRAGIVTSFQNTGCVMIDMASRAAPGLRVLTVDTLRLHQETYDLIAQLEERYGIAIERFQPDPDAVENMVQRHGEYLFFDSKAKQEYCCNIRKVQPNERALGTVDVWITGLRRDQSEYRSNIKKADVIKRGERTLLKLCPLADWTEADVWSYIRTHGTPYNSLYDKGYTSIGCVICTTPTLPGEDKRAGRWRWFNHLEGDNKECGIHMGGGGI